MVRSQGEPGMRGIRRLRVAIATNEMTDQEIERLEALLQDAPADR